MTAEKRRILIVVHTGRPDSVDAAVRVHDLLVTAGAIPVMDEGQWDELGADRARFALAEVLGRETDIHQVELAIVLGGDGTILRAAEVTRGSSAPILGVNMGHVGFLTESERDDLDDAVHRVIARDYRVEERMTLDVCVTTRDDEVIFSTWALNEATVEKASRERMLEVIIEIDERPLSSFGCDGVIIATPTGSTAYNFSAGGPVIWPTVEAIALVPMAAHALFARPLVVGPEAAVAIELMERTAGRGVLWCDGRRSHELPPGARVVVRRSPEPVRLARLHAPAFTNRLVNKFRLPVEGWRGHPRPDEGASA